MNRKLKYHLRRAARRFLGARNTAGRSSTWEGYTADALQLADIIDCTNADLAQPQQHPERVTRDPKQQIANWYLPLFDNPFYGGVMTILRFAAYMRNQGVRQRFLMCGEADTQAISRMIASAFPELAHEEVRALDSAEALASIPPSDFSFATLWTTAYVLLRVQNTGLKIYFMQDYEPLFYPAGSTFAQTELTYRFGFIGLANTSSIRDIYVGQYGGVAHALSPCVDTTVFHAHTSERQDSPRLLFYYARPGTPRNGFELASSALRRLKQRLGASVRILCAGANWNASEYGLETTIEQLGLLPYAETGNLYRRCHVGLVMMMTRHPSYLPFELMACGSLVVSNWNPANAWFLRDRENCLLAPASATALAETLEDALVNWSAHEHVRRRGTAEVADRHADWNRELGAAYEYLQAQVR